MRGARCCKSRLFTFHKTLRNVKTICFSQKYFVYLYSEEEKARKHRVFSSFLAQNGGDFLSEIKFFSGAGEKFLGASGNFLGAVGAHTSLPEFFLGS